jgi:hypothetical protein
MFLVGFGTKFNFKNPNRQLPSGKREMLRQKQKKNLTVNMAAPYVEGMATLLQDGLYTNQTEIVKDALRRLFIHYEIKMVTEEPT